MAEEIANGAAGATPETANQPIFALQRVYIKDASFEAPNAPQIFQEQGQPELQLNLGQKVSSLSEGVFEVVLTVSLTCTVNSKNAYLAEVQQAGIFTVAGFDAQNTDGLLGTYAPNTLFPYARRAVSDMVQDGGFPPFLLQPINFDQIYAEALRRRQEQGEGQPATTPDAGHA
ncbi:protein-export chaperone SecB [Xanthomonadaceae bacterium JHOS43]|nr:protein-export chaperone SecB [Xanthomonadaceae bacterium JHOS43]MCX7564441.1 protein-export chaperone SecB [Xanthomonadaceae bacterium XH05]